MAWCALIIAGFLEVVWAYAMKESHGFTKLTPSIVTVVTMLASFSLLSFSMRTLPLGTAYAIWVGIGALGAAIVGIIMFNEPASAIRLLCLGLLMISLVGLKLSH